MCDCVNAFGSSCTKSCVHRRWKLTAHNSSDSCAVEISSSDIGSKSGSDGVGSGRAANNA